MILLKNILEKPAVNVNIKYHLKGIQPAFEIKLEYRKLLFFIQGILKQLFMLGMHFILGQRNLQIFSRILSFLCKIKVTLALTGTVTILTTVISLQLFHIFTP